MTRLVLINGAPASGKSTLARRYVDEHPLALLLDVDVVRGMLGGWLQQPTEAGLIARRLAIAMARVQLGEGRDVVVPQFLGRLEFVLALQELCDAVGARFVEVALLSDAGDATRRFVDRVASSSRQEHADAAALQDRSGGVAALPLMYKRLLEVVSSRPNTHTINVVEGEVDRTYADLLACL